MNAMTPPQLRILYHHRIAASDGMRVHVAGLVQALRDARPSGEVGGSGRRRGRAGGGRARRLERVIDGLRRRLPRWASKLVELLYNVPAYARLSRRRAPSSPT
jgi:hypothetical protein